MCFILFVIEIDSCHDNCGRISNGYECSCDWECHYYNNCCPDLTEKCPYSKYLTLVLIVVHKFFY